MNSAKTIYRAYLQTALAHTAKMSARQVESILTRFDNATATTNNAPLIFRTLLESYGNEDTARAEKTVQAIIASALLPLSQRAESIKMQLEQFSKDHPGVDTNCISKIRATIEKYNAKLDMCGAQIKNKQGEWVDAVNESELKDIQISMPKVCETRKQVYSAWASSGLRNKIERLDFEILR